MYQTKTMSCRYINVSLFGCEPYIGVSWQDKGKLYAGTIGEKSVYDQISTYPLQFGKMMRMLVERCIYETNRYPARNISFHLKVPAQNMDVLRTMLYWDNNPICIIQLTDELSPETYLCRCNSVTPFNFNSGQPHTPTIDPVIKQNPDRFKQESNEDDSIVSRLRSKRQRH